MCCALQKRIKGLEMERDTVKDQMTMAEKELQKAEDLAEMLSDSKTVRLWNANVHVLYPKTHWHCRSRVSQKFLSGPNMPSAQINIPVFCSPFKLVFVTNKLHPFTFSSVGIWTAGSTDGWCQDWLDQEGEWDYQGSF